MIFRLFFIAAGRPVIRADGMRLSRMNDPAASGRGMSGSGGGGGTASCEAKPPAFKREPYGSRMDSSSALTKGLMM